MQRKSSRTDQIHADAARSEISASVRQLIRDLPVPAAVIDAAGHAWIWNAAAELLFPPPHQSSSSAQYPLFSVGAQTWFGRAWTAATLGRGLAGLAWLIRGVGGTRYRLGVTITPIRDDDGETHALLALLRDRTRDERRARHAVRQARSLGKLLNTQPDAVIVHRNGEIVYANQCAATMFGVPTPRALVGAGLDNLVAVQGNTAPSRVKARTRGHIAKPGARPVELFPTSLMFHKRAATAVTLRDVPETQEARIHRSEERLRGVTEGLTRQGVIMLDELGYVTGWNAGAESVTGYGAAEIIGRDLTLIHAGEVVEGDAPSRGLRAAMAYGKFEEEGWKRRKDGTRFWCHLSVTALFDRDQTIEGFAVGMTDLTQERAGEDVAQQTDDQLRQAQRMEAIGRLAGGIAHDFNNLLTAIQGHAQFLLEDLPADHPSAQDAQEIRKSADRATALTRQLLAFSRRQELQPKIVNLNEIITEMGTLLRRVISEDIQLNTTLESDLWPVRADPGQIEQVIMNLVVNARDAMPGGGIVTVRTINVDLDDAYSDVKLDVAPGPYVLLSVSDNGIGMDSDTKAHIFEPFFTTKEPGKGTGLGLATVYGIVKQSDGHIWVYSEPGHGTTFKIYLPRVASGGEMLNRPLKFRDGARSGETVLVIEDEAAVRTLARRVLEQRGYHVLEAANGQEALQIAGDRAGPIHLMLSDVVVPDMNGRRIADQILPQRPETKVLFMSGYTDEDVRQHGVLEAGEAFLEKPFTPDSLARKVREVLDTAN